jgi:hypothetical protein
MNLRSIYNFIDWSKGDDAQIAAALGVTRQAVAAARKVRRVAPKSNHGGKREGAGRKPKQAVNALRKGVDSLPTGSDLVTPCCKVSAIVAGGDEGKRWHECPKCGQPCDPVELDAVPYDDENGEHSDGLGVPLYHHVGDSNE